MDRSSHVTLGGFLIGAVTAFPAGVLFQIARRAWKDHSGLQAATDMAGKAKWKLSGQGVALIFFLVVVAALALGGIAEMGRGSGP